MFVFFDFQVFVIGVVEVCRRIFILVLIIVVKDWKFICLLKEDNQLNYGIYVLYNVMQWFKGVRYICMYLGRFLNYCWEKNFII